ncbi:MAG: lipid-A-disaccharide synthase [Deltaproteobacteria bacterium]|nr:lipid-A-disaccharide synthase [Deltaproteobacteria bacterium]MDA8305449.1 lipid-A-disaccharide synthase [Deltaproteobacteria bacterium]
MEIFISAGEASGDLHGANLARAIWAIAPQTNLSCLGGPHMKSAGVPVIVDNRKISVVGISEAAAQIRSIYGAWVKIRSYLLANRPSIVVLIDFPDFNLFLARFAKRIGARVYFYISPQVWAWRKKRVKKIGRLMDGMAVILPFEKDFYASYGIEVDYVGHPLVDSMKNLPDKAQCDQVYHGFDGPLVGLLPGSRRKEVERFFDMLMEAARCILKSMPEARFIMPVASSIDARELQSRVSRRSMPVQVVSNDTHSVVRACDLILTKTGTVTLEAAILETPMIAFYKVSRVTRRIVEALVTTEFAALPNLIAGREIVPEFARQEPTGQLLAECALRLLKDPGLLREQRLELRRIRGQLGSCGISDRVARLVLDTALQVERKRQ